MDEQELMEQAYAIFDKDQLDKTDIERLREIQEDLAIVTNNGESVEMFGELISQAMIDPDVYNP